MSPLTEPTKLTLAKSFTQQPYMWEFPQQHGLWHPGLISTALWLDAADASTVTTVSGAVSQWNDKSGNNRHLLQATANQRPIVSVTSFNGRNTLEFDGVDDTLVNTSAGLPIGNSARTAVIVYRPLRTSSVNTIASQGIANTAGGWFALQSRPGSVDPYFAGYSADLSFAGSPTLTTKIAVATYDGTTVVLTRDGSALASGARTLNTNGDIFRVGASAGAEYAQMLVAEIIYLSSSANTTTRQKLEGYLAHKWGLTANLPAGHPYKTVGPTP